MSKILIVEDDLSIQALLHDFIEEAGHSVALCQHERCRFQRKVAGMG